jgi:glycosyltransferase involved in cell wall biosynthesis
MISVLMPAYNEAQTIGRLVRACLAHTPPPCEVLVVDDGSADETASLATAAGARVVRLPENRGKGVAVREGFAAARGDVVVMLDADGQDDPAEIPDLLAALTDDVDMVVGSRFRGHFGAGSITPLNYAGNRFLTLVLNVLFSTRMTDTLAGFKAVRASRLRGLQFEARRYDIEVELLLRLLRAGARVVEIPVRRAARVHGTSRLDSFRDGTRVLGRIVRMRLGEG